MCPKCQTPLFFDFDGNPQVGDSVGDPPSAEPEFIESVEDKFSQEEPPRANDPHSDRPVYESELNQSFKQEIQDLAFAAIEENQDEVLFHSEEPTQEKDFSAFSTVKENGLDDENAPVELDLNDPLGMSPPAQSIVTGEMINAESNSEVAGHLLYEIEIEGIDGSKLRNELYDELKDPRWGWVAMELMGSIKLGRLVLKDVNAVKASLLVNRLKGLPLEIKWKQNI
jgi:hypothetical protein